MVKSKGSPPEARFKEKARAVRVVEAPEVSVVPRAVGWGYVRPGQEWAAVAEVAGRLVDINPRLKKGAIIFKDELLVRIDPAQRRTAEAQADAGVKNLLARLEELDRKEENAPQPARRGAQDPGHLPARSLSGAGPWPNPGVISQSEVDLEEKVFLTQRNKVRNYANTLNLVPAEREALMAEVASARSRLADKRLDLEKTEIRAPFDCRIASEDVELGQAVNVGQVLVQADSMAVSEVLAQIPMSAMRKIVPELSDTPFLLKDGGLDMHQVLGRMGLTAVVRLNPDGGAPIEWNARVSRVSESIDPKTRSVGVYVAVDNPYGKSRGSARPPLIRNMYGQVEIHGKPRSPGVVIPRSALRAGTVSVCNADNRLELRRVETDYTSGRLVSITKGVRAGEKVVITDLVPAVEGMLLDPVEDRKALDALMAEANATGGAK